jgi:hypothetical protein
VRDLGDVAELVLGLLGALCEVVSVVVGLACTSRDGGFVASEPPHPLE